MPTEPADADGKVGVFGYGVRVDASRGFDGFLAPSTQRAGDHGDAVEQIESALLHILAGDVLESLPTGQPERTVADFHVAGDRAYFFVGEMAQELADGVGLDFGVGVDGDDDFRFCFAERAGERRGLPAVYLVKDGHPWVLPKISVQQFAGAVARPIVDDDDVQILQIRSEHGFHGLHDHRFFIVSWNQHGNAGRRVGHDQVIGPQFFDEAENADNQGSPADHHDAHDENVGHAEAEPLPYPEHKLLFETIESLYVL